MLNFDKLVNKARDVAEVASKKTGEVIDISKLKLKSAGIKADISKIHERIGSLVCQAAKSGTNFDQIVDKLVEDAKALEDELYDLETEINSSKGVKICPKCGASNSEKAQFCVECGSSFYQNTQAESEYKIGRAHV